MNDEKEFTPLTIREFEDAMAAFANHPYVAEYRPIIRSYLRLKELCIWTEEDADSGTWGCDKCGLSWTFQDGEPEENNIHYCPSCGREIQAFIHWKDED